MHFSRRTISFATTIAFVSIVSVIVYFLSSPPADFPSGSVIAVAEGASASEVTKEFADAQIIKHPALLEILLRISGNEGGIQAGNYRFEMPQNLFTVAQRLITGSYGFPAVRMTFVEGTTVREMGAQIAQAFPTISSADFLKEGKQYEGYLFPDTYFFPPSADIALIIKAMRENFDTKISALSANITASRHTISDSIIMASLIEKEARTTGNRKIVSGILWSRLALGMPLQVDAVFGYIFNRDTYSPSFADLKVDSPYNTYVHAGLPPGPINNPGLDAILAALHPTKTNYLYYLTDKNGVMRYATTFAEHQANQRKYLK